MVLLCRRVKPAALWEVIYGLAGSKPPAIRKISARTPPYASYPVELTTIGERSPGTLDVYRGRGSTTRPSAQRMALEVHDGSSVAQSPTRGKGVDLDPAGVSGDLLCNGEQLRGRVS